MNFKFADEQGHLTGTSLPPHIIELLDAWQQEARQEREPIPTELTFSYIVGDKEYTQPLLMRPHGSSIWPWLLFSDDVKVSFAPGTLTKGLFCQVRFSSHLLHMLGTERAITELESMLYDFLGQLMHEQCSEIHICLDLQGFDFSRLQLIGSQLPFVSRVTRIRDRVSVPTEEEQEGGLTPLQVRKLEETIQQEQEEPLCFHPVSICTAHRKIETLDFGSHASDISAQIYNKTKEVKKHHKEWMPDVWLANGWDGYSEVWRLECRIKRAFLRQFELENAFEVLHLLPLLWRYCTEQWLRFVDLEVSHGSNVSRLVTHPVWQLVQHAYDELQDEAAAGDPQAEHDLRLKHLAQEKPLQTIKQAVALTRYAELQASLYDGAPFLVASDLAVLSTGRESPVSWWRAVLSFVFLSVLPGKHVLTDMNEEWEVIDTTLRDEPSETLQVLAQEALESLPAEEQRLLVDALVPRSFAVVRTELIKRKRRMAKRQTLIAGVAGYLRSAVALLNPGEAPGSSSTDIPDLFSSVLWLFEQIQAYDKTKGREHKQEVHKKQLRHDFVTALQREREHQELGVVWSESVGRVYEDVRSLLLQDSREIA